MNKHRLHRNPDYNPSIDPPALQHFPPYFIGMKNGNGKSIVIAPNVRFPDGKDIARYSKALSKEKWAQNTLFIGLFSHVPETFQLHTDAHMIFTVSREEITYQDLEPLILNERELQASSGDDEEEEETPEREVTPELSKSRGKRPLFPTPRRSASKTPPRTHRYPTRSHTRSE
jgi:hypothetical protein